MGRDADRIEIAGMKQDTLTPITARVGCGYLINNKVTMRLQQVLLFLGLLFLAWSCKCANEKGRIEENLVLQSVPATTSRTHPIKDTIVSLSF